MKRGPELLDAIRRLPRELIAPEVAVRRRVTVDGARQVEVFDHAERTEIKHLADRVCDLVLANRCRAEGVDVQADRVRPPNGVGELNLAAARGSGGNHVLRDPTSRVGRGAVNL